MCEFYPYFTNDGSVGLYSKADDDIYHSTYGALSEAYEKFILPANIKQKNEIKVLDICFGIGYNSKSFLEYFLNSAAIDTDNIARRKLDLHVVDTDKMLMNLSPFIISSKKFYKQKLSFEDDRVSKLLRKSKHKYKITKEIDIILFIKMFENNPEFLDEIKTILKEKKYKPYFDKFMVNFSKFYQNQGCKYKQRENNSTFLHNIYYRYISNSYKKATKILQIEDVDINFYNQDARKHLQQCDTTYDYIFLDAFTPAKCPCLWTYEFFKELYNHLSDDGMIITYSHSSAVRNAFLQNGFYIGKVYNEEAKKFTCTIACKNKNLIKNELDDYDMGLINTKAGIMYHDENFSLDNDTIIKNRNEVFANSNLVCSSRFIKDWGKNNEL